MVNNSFFPRITLRTRFAKKSRSLLDQIFVKQRDDNNPGESLLLFSALSDHLACVASVCKRPERIVAHGSTKKRHFNNKSIAAFSQDIKSVNFLSICNNDLSIDPNVNNNILHDTLCDALDKHIPIKDVKFNKYKHKKSGWITEGILTSIKYRDKLYKLKKCSVNDDEYEQNSENLRNYQNILNKTIHEAKFHYYQNQFHKHKNDMRR